MLFGENCEYKRFWQRHFGLPTMTPQVLRAARASLKLGLPKHHGVAILGFNCYEWFVAKFGAIFAGGIDAGVYPTNGLPLLRFFLSTMCCVLLYLALPVASDNFFFRPWCHCSSRQQLWSSHRLRWKSFSPCQVLFHSWSRSFHEGIPCSSNHFSPFSSSYNPL